MTSTQETQTKTSEGQEKGTNWYLVGGVALATGLAIAAVATVLTSKKQKRQVFECGGQEEEIVWTEDSQFLTNLFATTKSTFSRMWNSTVNGIQKLDSVIRNQIQAPQTTPLFPTQEEVTEKAIEMNAADDTFYIADF